MLASGLKTWVERESSFKALLIPITRRRKFRNAKTLEHWKRTILEHVLPSADCRLEHELLILNILVKLKKKVNKILLRSQNYMTFDQLRSNVQSRSILIVII